MSILNASLYVNYFAPTGIPGEYLIENAEWNNQADVYGSGAYAAKVGDVIYVQASDINTFMPIPGVLHRYRFTSVTPVDANLLSGTIVWDEIGSEVDTPTNGVYCLYSETTSRFSIGNPPSDVIYPQFPVGSSVASLALDLSNIVEPSLGHRVFADSLDPTSEIGLDGDNYLNTTNGSWFVKELGVWSLKTSLQGGGGTIGPTGPTGPIGPTGPGGTSQAVRYYFGTPSRTWLIEHNKNTDMFLTKLVDSNGEIFYAKISDVTMNSFKVNMTIITSGYVDVFFS